MDLVDSNDSEFKTLPIQEDTEDPNDKDIMDIPNETLDFLYNQQIQTNNSNGNNTEVMGIEGPDHFETRFTMKLTYIIEDNPE